MIALVTWRLGGSVVQSERSPRHCQLFAEHLGLAFYDGSRRSSRTLRFFLFFRFSRRFLTTRSTITARRRIVRPVAVPRTEMAEGDTPNALTDASDTPQQHALVLVDTFVDKRL